ncbi:hypothetical protein [Streptomyces sp. NPDC003863]
MTLAVVLLASVLVIALLAGVGAGRLVRLEGAMYPTALTRAAIAFTTVVTLASAITGALAGLLNRSPRVRRGAWRVRGR